MDVGTKALLVLRSMAIEIRNWDPALAPHFARLNREWIEALFALEPADEAILANPQALVEAGGEIVFAVDGGEVVGTAGLQRLDGRTMELVKMAVTPARQGRGVGARLIAALIETAKARGFERIYIETNASLTASNHLYQKFGFDRIDQGQSQHGFTRADAFYELWLNRSTPPPA